MDYGATMTFTLYHHGSSVCAAKVRLAMAEKDLQWNGVYIDILKGEQFNPDYLKLNPKGVVPTLVHDDLVIPDSTVIIEYLDQIDLRRHLGEVEYILIEGALRKSSGSVTEASKSLKINRTTLIEKMKKYSIPKVGND